MDASLPNPTLEVRDLRLVLALVEHGSTANAGRVLHLAQPSVSRALLSLEERLQAELFTRNARGLQPTPTGSRLAREARALLTSMSSLERDLRAPAASPRRVRLVCECYTAYHWLPSTLAALQPSLPELRLTLQVEHTTDPLGALQRGEIDAALITSPCRSSPALKVRPLMSDEIVFLLSRAHPLAARPNLTREDLLATPLFTQRAPEAEARWFLRAVFGNKRPRLRVNTVPLTEAMVDLARAGMGIAISSEWVVQPYLGRGGFVAKRLDKGPLLRQWRFAWRPELGEVGPRLYRALRDSL